MPFQLTLQSTFGTAFLNKAKSKYSAKTGEKAIFAAHTAKTIGNECSLSVQSIWKMLPVKSEHPQTMQWRSKVLLKRNGATEKGLCKVDVVFPLCYWKGSNGDRIKRDQASAVFIIILVSRTGCVKIKISLGKSSRSM